jgi:hypothetical protein
MRPSQYLRSVAKETLFSILLMSSSLFLSGQHRIGFGIHADPVISWFSSDNKNIRNDGARPGFNFGLTYNSYFAPNYSFSAGICLINAGGRLISRDTMQMFLKNYSSNPVTVMPGNAVVYRIQYLSFPLGLKLQTDRSGPLSFFTDLGLDPKVVIGGKADIPSVNISGENAMEELGVFNISYHLMAGVEYSLGITTAIVAGINFENNFLDITRENGNQPPDRISHKLFSFRIGINF